ncbi:hypothetical protein AVI51_16665 (plasmid) [Piscirickettsia salmonis]|uniref:Uncharacterized protein n=2 Tax=Piscirickettsia salmonis TaxID=1238 RepID=A0A9Q6LPJ4_PISSA|nr:hypothetical protein [Piscirickettsia salmonis]ALA26570.1 diguanylate cyclase [Piscirickettsia salmonis]APS45948.1 hypothetical protein AVI48_16080 [Piscirickettsia salmonis]APS49309.1 hypothetical protein AVI49_16755 [Piscirickettsia salmonis]APS52495.1 hypothetical protein AVI50_16725 [Piscirickettsia salmonis]APS55734.1 hypothetical protein AVI51_16665 [Piscirickettsia salmonis]
MPTQKHMEKITNLIDDLQKRITKLDGQIEAEAKSSFISSGLLEREKSKGSRPVEYYHNVREFSRKLLPKIASWARKALLLCECKNFLEEMTKDDSKALEHATHLNETYLRHSNLAVFEARFRSMTKSLCSKTYKILKSIAKENQQSAVAATNCGGGAYAVADIVNRHQSSGLTSVEEGLQVVELPQTQPAMQG